ncbi:hypothetical protein PR202_ga05874 [Eleusine coracana subsp. coracana]|uniref:non-specific serine/threonine protein kinase n=1 Tax=Eleusine coracana subsp. coracana TaxID=191504 RepID=A0AAV5BVA2_ELECO|nr:hypothetical protein PR202_ga05874 [Eleusine coracana subsp. coracana]
MPRLILFLLAAASLAAHTGAEDDKRYNASMCEASFPCGSHVNIHYPFFLANATTAIDAYSYCGYPGMAVACDDGRATLRLKEDNYTVLNIDYDNHTVTVADADVLDGGGGGGDCPRVKHNVTVPEETWLNLSTAANDNLVFFFDCAFAAGTPKPPPAALPPINCSGFREGSGMTSFVAVQPDVPPKDSLPGACRAVITVPVLKYWLDEYLPWLNYDGYGKVLKQGFQLTWDPSAGPCFVCEDSRGQCSYNQNGEFLGCLCSDGRVRNPGCEPMHCLRLAPLLFIVLLASLPPSRPQQPYTYFRYSNCRPTPYRCGSVQFDIGYPFSVNGVDRPDYCSYPGYRLSCTNGKLVITMKSDEFQVTSVDYDNHLLTVIDQSLADEQACLQPYRNTTIDEAMFTYTDRDLFLTVYINCSARSSPFPFAYDLFSCLSGGRSYYSLDNGTVAPDLLGSCSSTLVVPYNSTMAASLTAGSSSLGDAIKTGPKSKKKLMIVIGTSIAAGVLFVLLVVVSFLYIRKRREYEMTSSSSLLKYTASGGTPRSNKWSISDTESGSVHDLQTHHFTYEELEDATDGFSDEREIGDGGFGTVYKGQLRDGRVVAVKRLYSNSLRRVEQFVNEAAILSRLRHPNLVALYGCTSSRSRALLLVYELVPNGTVADHLHGSRAAERALAWPLRLRVAVEAAAALAYLHAVDPPVVHRDVKTSNILLDGSFHVKVADFGLSRLFPADATHVSTAPQGTPGYVDPEYHQCYQLTDRSDVYSFGVVLVELVSSKPAVDVTRDRDEINLAAMAVAKIQRGEVDQLVDRELGFDDADQATRRTMTMVAELAFRCLQQNGEMRPAIREVLDALRSIQGEGFGKKVNTPPSPDTVHAPWDSISTTPSVSQ